MRADLGARHFFKPHSNYRPAIASLEAYILKNALSLVLLLCIGPSLPMITLVILQELLLLQDSKEDGGF